VDHAAVARFSTLASRAVIVKINHRVLGSMVATAALAGVVSLMMPVSAAGQAAGQSSAASRWNPPRLLEHIDVHARALLDGVPRNNYGSPGGGLQIVQTPATWHSPFRAARVIRKPAGQDARASSSEVKMGTAPVPFTPG